MQRHPNGLLVTSVLATALFGCSSAAPPAQPTPCEETCQDRVALRAVREMTKFAYNILLQGKPVGAQDQAGPCPLGGALHVFGTASSNADQGATEVDLKYAFDACAHMEVDSEPDENYRMTLTGTLTQVGTLAVQPTATTALLMASDAMSMDGTVHDPPLEYHASDCPLSLNQDGNDLSGLMCGREVGVDLGGNQN